MLKKVKVEDAIGMTLAHDVTKVIPGQFKGPLFRRGHIIKKEDIPDLLSIGKEHIYIMDLNEGEIHEEEAALRIASAISGNFIEIDRPKEGRVNMKSTVFGIAKINVNLLREINLIGDIVIATLNNYTICNPGKIVAGTKITPLYIKAEKLELLEKICQDKGKVIEILPFKPKRIGVIITGNEIYKGRIEDKFYGVMKRKVEAFGSTIIDHTIVPDDIDLIAKTIVAMKAKNIDMLIVCGGLSIDPDDCTVDGVRESGARIISYGAPVMPGAMFLLAMLDSLPILGAPGAVIYNHATIFDLILPRILAGEIVTREDIIELAHGGLCLNCEKCSFPICPFGK